MDWHPIASLHVGIIDENGDVEGMLRVHLSRSITRHDHTGEEAWLEESCMNKG